MIESMSIRKRRAMFIALMLLGPLTPVALLAVALLLGDGLKDPLVGVFGVAIVGIGLALPLPFLYYSAKAAAWSELPGGGLTVLVTWWAIGLLAAFTNWSFQLGDALVSAATLGVISPTLDGAYATPPLLVQHGVSKSFAFQLPLYVLWLMGSYTVAQNRRARRELELERKALREPWDEHGERVSSESAQARLL